MAKTSTAPKPSKKVQLAERKVRNAERALKAHRSEARKKTQKYKTKLDEAVVGLKAAKK